MCTFMICFLAKSTGSQIDEVLLIPYVTACFLVTHIWIQKQFSNFNILIKIIWSAHWNWKKQISFWDNFQPIILAFSLSIHSQRLGLFLLHVFLSCGTKNAFAFERNLLGTRQTEGLNARIEDGMMKWKVLRTDKAAPPPRIRRLHSGALCQAVEGCSLRASFGASRNSTATFCRKHKV